MNLDGKKVLITGASRGIGKEIALAFLQEGSSVWGTSRNPEAIDWPSGIHLLALDLSRPESIDAFWVENRLAELEIDILINNAGSCCFGSFSEISIESWQRDLNTLLLGPMRLMQLALPGLDDRSGYLVSISSLAVEFPIPFMASYNASKSGLSALTESLMTEGFFKRLRTLDFRLGDFNTNFNADMSRSGKLSSKEEDVWRVLLDRAKRSPHPESAARSLIRALKRDSIGVIRAGSFFQSVIAPFFARFLSKSLQRSANQSYYKLK